MFVDAELARAKEGGAPDPKRTALSHGAEGSHNLFTRTPSPLLGLLPYGPRSGRSEERADPSIPLVIEPDGCPTPWGDPAPPL